VYPISTPIIICSGDDPIGVPSARVPGAQTFDLVAIAGVEFDAIISRKEELLESYVACLCE